MTGLRTRALGGFDWFLFFVVVAICVLSLQNLYSGSHQFGTGLVIKQLIWLVLGLGVCLYVSRIDYRVIMSYTVHAYVLTIALLVTVLIVGKTIGGATSWIAIGSIATFQPSEVSKLAIILALASFYYHEGDGGVGSLGLIGLIRPVLIAGLPMALVIIQPDLGTFMMMALITGSIVLFMGVRPGSIAILAVVLVSCAVPMWQFFLKNYQKERILTFLDPSRDPLGAGYNAIQAQIAVGSGGLLGKGFMQGSQTQLSFIPEQHTDFAFSVIAEEWGFAGAILTILLFSIVILWSLDTASRARDKFAGVVCVGVASMLFWHMFINIGMVTGILPVTGVPLMMFSYGGSSALTALIGIGMVLGIRLRTLRAQKVAIDY